MRLQIICRFHPRCRGAPQTHCSIVGPEELRNITTHNKIPLVCVGVRTKIPHTDGVGVNPLTLLGRGVQVLQEVTSKHLLFVASFSPTSWHFCCLMFSPHIQSFTVSHTHTHTHTGSVTCCARVSDQFP